MRERQAWSFSVRASYQFYNGSGTWRGQQDTVLTFKVADGSDLKPPVRFGLDRGHCVGGAQARSAEGVLPFDAKLVAGVAMEVTRVTGTQTPC